MFRLIQAAYIPTVCYGLEFVTGYSPYVKRIQIHVNDCIRHLYRMLLRLATNVMLADTGITPVHIQGAYLQKRCYARMINYGYGRDMPWWGCIRNGWGDGMNISPLMMESNQLLTIPPAFDNTIDMDKAKGTTAHSLIVDAKRDSDDVCIYTDASKHRGGVGCAWVSFQRGLADTPRRRRLPNDYNIVEAELMGMLGAL